MILPCLLVMARTKNGECRHLTASARRQRVVNHQSTLAPMVEDYHEGEVPIPADVQHVRA